MLLGLDFLYDIVFLLEGFCLVIGCVCVGVGFEIGMLVVGVVFLVIGGLVGLVLVCFCVCYFGICCCLYDDIVEFLVCMVVDGVLDLVIVGCVC